MNILLDKLPTSIIANGEKLKINPDFRVWIEVSYVLDTLTEKITSDILAGVTEKIIELAFYEQPRTINDKLFIEIIDFYSGYSQKVAKASGKVERVFDYKNDSELIYASFAQQYGIRLINEQMHWIEFSTLFKNLGEDTAFRQVVRIRTMKANDVPKEQRSDLAKLKELYKLPISKDDEELISKLSANLSKRAKING